ncbi:hypothetical protein E2C01_022202 [Portunus trituberculatus]|uniref:Uncharacterized protein n=1 Tax=Portunus trituberculatus TaxID=210409 RepID=A0A5B7E6L9_PORTR|nr:hypothetical protein [Portunus trituberculatus]
MTTRLSLPATTMLLLLHATEYGGTGWEMILPWEWTSLPTLTAAAGKLGEGRTAYKVLVHLNLGHGEVPWDGTGNCGRGWGGWD